MNKQVLLKLALISLLSFAFCAKAVNNTNLRMSKSAENAKVYIIEPVDGAVVSEKLVVKFGLIGMEVAPAGSDKSNSGHHHLLIDSEEIPPAGVPMGKNVMHFGGGQTETILTLTKGTHTLQLILGDKFHIPHEPMLVSKQITIRVK